MQVLFILVWHFLEQSYKVLYSTSKKETYSTLGVNTGNTYVNTEKQKNSGIFVDVIFQLHTKGETD